MRDIKGEEIWSVKEGKKRKGEYRAEKKKGKETPETKSCLFLWEDMVEGKSQGKKYSEKHEDVVIHCMAK